MPRLDQSNKCILSQRQYGNTSHFIIDSSEESLYVQAKKGNVTIKNIEMVDMSNVQITVQNNTDQYITIVIPPGKMIMPENQDCQNLVVINEKKFIIPPEKQITQHINTACGNLERQSPNNQPGLFTPYRNPGITEGMTQSDVWEKIQKLVSDNAQQKNRIKQQILEISNKLFQLIENKTVKIQNVEIQGGYIMMKIQNPSNKVFKLYPQNSNGKKLTMKEANKLLKDVDGDYTYGKVKTSWNQKFTVIAFPAQNQKVDPNSKIDVILQKDKIKQILFEHF